nr:tape measure protein [Parerythrobacter lacustris]
MAVGTAGTVAFAGLALLTKGAIRAGVDFEQTRIAFETMLGSAEQAQKTLAELSQFAARTPFELGQLEEASKRLLAYGTSADDLIPTLKMLGDITAGVGMDKLPQLILAFGQVQAATKLTGAELRQFSEAGVPLLGALADELGKTEAQIIQMVSEGSVGFEQVKSALAGLSGEGGKFFNLMEAQSASLGGMWSNLRDQVALTARTIGTELMPYLKPLVDQLILVAQSVGNFAKEHPKLTAVLLIGALAFTALMAALLPIAVALPGLIVMWGLLTGAMAGPALIAAAVVAAIASIGVALYYLNQANLNTAAGWQDVWLGIKIIAAEQANAVIGIVESMINFVLSGVNKAIEAINKVIRLANKVPGINLKSIRSIDAVDLGGIDVGSIFSKDLAGRSTVPQQNTVVMQGNTFLSADIAEQIGDLIMGKLKLSSQL